MARTALESCFGGVWWGLASAACGSGECVASAGGGLCCSLRCCMPFVRVCPGACHRIVCSCASVPVPSLSWPLGGFLLPCCVVPLPCPCGRLPVILGPSSPPCRGVPSGPLPSACPCPFPSRFVGGGVGWGRAGRRWLMPGVGGLEPPAEVFGGLGGTEALDRISEQGFQCRLRHVGLRGGLAGVGGGTGAHLFEGVHHVHALLASPPPRPTSPSGRAPARRGQSNRRGWRGAGGWGKGSSSSSWTRTGYGGSVKFGGARGGGGGGVVDMRRRWRAWRCLEERKRRRWGLGLEDAYWRRGEREAWRCPRGEGDGDMGRQCRAWRRPGERERQWRGPGGEDACGRHGERDARCCSRGEGDGDMGRRWPARRGPGEQERREWGPGGSWWRLGEQEWRE